MTYHIPIGWRPKPVAHDAINAADVRFEAEMERASSELLASMWREDPFEMAKRTGRLRAPELCR